MKAVLLLVLTAVLCHTVKSYCTSCSYDTAEADCNDPFTPSGPVINICNTVNVDLCSKYGDYAIYCQTGALDISCKKYGYCSNVNSSCTACSYGTAEADCTDPWIPSGPVTDICDSIDADLCSRYGDYTIYCQKGGVQTSCTKRGECSNAMSSCTACKYGTAKGDCTDPFTPSGPESGICDKLNEDLCGKYGDYAIYCQTGGLSTSCQKNGQCVNEARSLTPNLVLIPVILILIIKMAY